VGEWFDRPWQQSQAGNKMGIKINILNKNMIFLG
jgi:hypothetical protein